MGLCLQLPFSLCDSFLTMIWDRPQNCKSSRDFTHSSCKRQLLASLSDNSICSPWDKQHTTKQYLSEIHRRHDPLLVAIYSKRQWLCHLGAYVIRKMTLSKTWLPRRQWELCAFFCFCFFCGFFFLSLFWDLFEVFHSDVVWQESVAKTHT
jgi:hypothetical protein